jgi:transcriptional regulator GlxA family with amidase domain
LSSVNPHTHISAIKKTDLIIIPSLNHNYNKTVKENRLMIEWIEKQYRHGAEIASICTGAFLLASSGLLDGKFVLRIGRQQIIFEQCFQK